MHSTFVRLAILAVLGCAGMAAQAQAVRPPALPPGSNLVRADPGMAEPERKRHVRAHHHKFHHDKDYTRDDSVHGHESEAVVRTGVQGGAVGASAGTGAAPGPGPRAAGATGGAGTGPAREKTDKGASSYFHGNDKK
jgi:hypothetical protein